MDVVKLLASPPKEALRLPCAAWAEIVDNLNKQGEQALITSPPRRRIYERRRYTKVVRCVLRMKQDGGLPAVYLVRTRNLSEGGLGFFFSAYMHPDTDCHFAIMDLEGRGQIVSGKVRWCRHLSKTLHECGVQFDKPIVVERFLDPANTTID